MKRQPNFILPIIVVVLAVVGIFQGRHVDALRDSQALYDWMIATGTHMWQFSGEARTKRAVEYANDVAFLRNEVEPLVADQLPEIPAEALEDELERTTSKLAYLAYVAGMDATDAETADSDEDLYEGAQYAGADSEAAQELLFELAHGGALDGIRGEFLAQARNRDLKLTNYEGYVEGASIFNLFFGFRQLAANFLWLEVDRLWHQGTDHLMIPLMETCILLDPHFVDAFLLGAWHMAYNVTAQMDPTPQHLKQWSDEYSACIGEKESYYYWAADFLESGIVRNPRNYKLYFDLGFSIYKQKMEDYAKAVEALEGARRVPHEVWVPRQLYICYELNQEYEKAYEGWSDYASKYTESNTGTEVAPRFMQRNKGHIAEREMMKAREAAEAATDPAEKARLEAEAAKYRAEALEIWEGMGDAPIAVGRVLRMKALDLVREGKIRDAIGVLEKARWDSNDFWDEASEMIIRLKQEHGINLTLSEKKWVLRNESGGDCRGMPAELRSDASQD